MTITLEYKLVKRPVPLEPVKGPYIKVTLVGPKQNLQIVALLDSGADVSAIPSDIADILGLDKSGKEEKVVGLGGKLRAAKSRMGVIIEGAHEKHALPQVPVRIILDETEGGFPAIVGRAGFFDEFDIIFKEKNQKIVLKKV